MLFVHVEYFLVFVQPDLCKSNTVAFSERQMLARFPRHIIRVTGPENVSDATARHELKAPATHPGL